MTRATATDLLRVVNGNLRVALDRLRPEKHSCLDIQPENLSSLLADLLRAGDSLREMSGDGVQISPEFERQRSVYKDNLTELECRLPDLYRRLLEERSRLIEAQKHIDGAAAWAGSNRNTF